MPKIERRMSKSAIGVALILGSILIVLAYSTTGNSQSANAVASLAPQLPPETSLPPNLQLNLKHAANGNAQLVWDAKQMTLTVTITMSGLAPNSTAHAADIDKGSCETTASGLVTSLQPIVARTKPAGGGGGGRVTPLGPADPGNEPGGVGIGGGSFSKTTITSATVPQLKTGIPSSGWFIEVHNGATVAADKTAIACGDISNLNTFTTTNQFVDLTLGPTKDPNQEANGIATLVIANNQLTVTLTVSGLAPGSTHQAHIHQGSCRAQGPVVHPLTPVVVDKTGTGTSTTVIKGISSIPRGWYVNVHLGATTTALNTQTGFDPLVCGNVSPEDD